MLKQNNLGEEELKNMLQHIAINRVFFGHQSVGSNILDGIKDQATNSTINLGIHTLSQHKQLETGITHSRIGTNQDPISKFRAFDLLLEEGVASSADLALLKLCYIDINSETDTNSLFDTYSSFSEKWRANFPELPIVICTVPLTYQRRSIIGKTLSLLGQKSKNSLDNLTREQFNKRLKEYHGPAHCFDLAQLEATMPDGSCSYAPRTKIPQLYPGYTSDGGHLSSEGKTHIARALIQFLSAALSGKPHKESIQP